MLVGGGTAAVVGTRLGVERESELPTVFGVAPSAFSALTGLCVYIGMGAIWTTAFSRDEDSRRVSAISLKI